MSPYRPLSRAAVPLTLRAATMLPCPGRHTAQVAAALAALLLLAVPTEPVRSAAIEEAGSPCTGEFVLDAATDECVLAANGGFADEPTAWHPTCRGGFACPGAEGDPVRCVYTAAAYAACTRGEGEGTLQIKETAGGAGDNAGAASGAPCNLTGVWSCGGTECDIEQVSETGFSVRLATQQKFLWENATATVLANGSVHIVYKLQAGGTTARTGQVSHSCTAVAWNDSSTWSCQQCANAPVLDIHIIPHTHCDTGYVSTAGCVRA